MTAARLPSCIQIALVAVATAGLEGCGGAGLAPLQQAPLASAAAKQQSPIKHVVLVIQENRTFNDFFATFPGADGTTTGLVSANAGCKIATNGTIALTEQNLVIPTDLNHEFDAYSIGRAGGAMSGFDNIRFQNGKLECTYPYQYTNPEQIQPYWIMAKTYALAEHMFTTQGDSSFTAHQDLIAGGTVVSKSPGLALVNLPSCSNCRWGCDASPGTVTSLITENDQWQQYVDKGPFPCLTYETMATLLDAKDVSWKYYVPPVDTSFGKLLSAFDAIKAVRYGSDWNDVVTPQTAIFNDISAGTLPAVSWVIPDQPDSDHPGEPVDDGPSWVASIVNAIGESSYWSSTAVFIIWDDWGGLYDNIGPPQLGYGGLGFRVPAIVVSPYAKPHYISTTQYEFGSILKYIEKNFGLGSLGTSDVRAANIIDCFDYSQAPITFTPIPSVRSKSYFVRRKPSYLPPDTDW
ncbi:MAG TPA: alkaline phosphatase family protein [Candidatus Babeliales bacterium]|nr:alkaline phosphatase family protein [Candidatus Babeliales bacterium]